MDFLLPVLFPKHSGRNPPLELPNTTLELRKPTVGVAETATADPTFLLVFPRSQRQRVSTFFDPSRGPTATARSFGRPQRGASTLWASAAVQSWTVDLAEGWWDGFD